MLETLSDGDVVESQFISVTVAEEDEGEHKQAENKELLARHVVVAHCDSFSFKGGNSLRSK